MSNRESGPSQRKQPISTLTAQQLRSLSLTKRERRQGMWTTGQFSKLTGVNKRTLQDWSQERIYVKRNGKTSVRGSGILTAAEIDPGNGYRTYDINSLIEVSMIKLAQDSGYSQEEIRQITQGGASSMFAVTQAHIDQLVAQRHEIDKKIMLARIAAVMHGVKAADGVGPGRAEGPLIASLQSLVAEELLESLAATAGDCVAVAPEAVEPEGAWKPSGANKLSDDAEYAHDEPFLELAALWVRESAADSPESQCVTARWHAQLSRLFSEFPRAVFADAIEAWLSNGHSPILLELHFGEGFIEHILKVVETYRGAKG